MTNFRNWMKILCSKCNISRGKKVKKLFWRLLQNVRFIDDMAHTEKQTLKRRLRVNILCAIMLIFVLFRYLYDSIATDNVKFIVNCTIFVLLRKN